ncbi:MAG: hypothetical protein PHQ23_09515 [Candidatus Wallbacteria bacterium]|nr:hypothetical protein [Candidatus Wallbacteria bacterium]
MGKNRIPKDNQEFAGFIRQFGDALVEKGRDDSLLVEGGKELLAELEKFIAMDEKAKALDVQKKLANEEKYGIKGSMTEKAGGLIYYLMFKLGKSATELQEFHIR